MHLCMHIMHLQEILYNTLLITQQMLQCDLEIREIQAWARS